MDYWYTSHEFGSCGESIRFNFDLFVFYIFYRNIQKRTLACCTVDGNVFAYSIKLIKGLKNVLKKYLHSKT